MNFRWLQRFFDQPLPGHRPGDVIACALKELTGRVEIRSVSADGAVLILPSGLRCEVRERVERHFLMHIVALEFTVRVPGVAALGATVDIRHTGAIFRRGIACDVSARHRPGLAELTGRIAGEAELAAALLGLDFRRCRLKNGEAGWSILIEPYGGSQVVNRKPSFRRYIRLGDRHAEALVGALEGFFRVLSPPAFP